MSSPARTAAASVLAGLVALALGASCEREGPPTPIRELPSAEMQTVHASPHPTGGMPPGSPCAQASDCTSGVCAGGYCCAGPCADHCVQATCEKYLNSTCNSAGLCSQMTEIMPERNCPICGYDGLPTNIEPCDANCGYTCPWNDGSPCTTQPGDTGTCGGGHCNPTPQPAGAHCAANAACESGFCVELTCCSTACKGPCQGCENATGTCVPITCGALDECQLAGTCDPQKGCVNPSVPDGTPCSSGTCEGGLCKAPGSASGGSPSNGSSGGGPNSPGGCAVARAPAERGAWVALVAALALLGGQRATSLARRRRPGPGPVQ